MRNTFGTLFLTLCVALAGCQTSGKLGKSTSRPGGGAPDFVGVPDPPKEGTGSPATTASAPKERKGTLAGSVQDSYNRLKPGAIIQLIEVGAKDKKAPFQVMANKAGCFEVQNLVYGKRYELRAEAKVGNRVLTGSTTAVVPSPRVAIYLLQEEPASGGGGEGGDPAPPPSSPGTAAAGDDPQVTIGRPVPNADVEKGDRRDGDGPGPGGSTPSSISPPHGATDLPPKVTTGDPSLLAEIKPKGKSDDLPSAPPPPVANVPGRPHRPEKREAPGSGGEDFPLPPRSTGDLLPSGAPSANPSSPPAASGGAEARAPEGAGPGRLVVPSCVRVGNTVQSFALYDKDGVAREYRAPFKNKLILLDFWFGDCRPCRDVIPKLNQWHKKYKDHQVEIIGVNCEPYTTTLAEKKDAIRKAMAKHNIRIDYTELLSGGGKGDCPLVKQMLDGEGFPTLILLDQDGKVLYRVSGSNPAALNRLDWVMYNHLFPGRVKANPNR